MATALDHLKEHTVVVADTGDFNSAAAAAKLYHTSPGACGVPRRVKTTTVVLIRLGGYNASLAVCLVNELGLY
jgi:hypothetical protein